MNVDKQASIKHILLRYGKETADVFTDLVKDEPSTLTMNTMLTKFAQARRIVQSRKLQPSPTVVPFISRPVDDTINVPSIF